MSWTKDSKKLIINQGNGFAGLRVVDVATGYVSSTVDTNLLPSTSGYGVAVLDPEGWTLATFMHGVKLVLVPEAVSPVLEAQDTFEALSPEQKDAFLEEIGAMSNQDINAAQQIQDKWCAFRSFKK